MRSPLIALIVALNSVSAQNQERTRFSQNRQSLIDRLLRPNMELRNPQQGKIFRAGSTVVACRSDAKPGVVGPAVKPKTFADIPLLGVKKLYLREKKRRGYAPHSKAPRSSASQEPFADTRPAYVPSQVVTTSFTRDVRPAHDANLKVTGRQFVDQRTFRAQGKSQKSLSRANPPLTIDQVRELLNKNK